MAQPEKMESEHVRFERPVNGDEWTECYEKEAETGALLGIILDNVPDILDSDSLISLDELQEIVHFMQQLQHKESV